MRDLKSYENFMAANIKWPLPNEAENDLIEKSNEFHDKWPRASNIRSRDLALEVISPDLKSRLTDYYSALQGRAKKYAEICILAKRANVELHPVLSKVMFLEDLCGHRVADSTKDFMMKDEMRGVFSRVAFVIPVYAETNRDDIDWEAIEQLKKHFYGHSYRPKADQYEKIIKVFQAGQLLEEETAYKSWQEVADSVGLGFTTVRYIYERAHQLVLGFPAKKRHYGVEEEVVIPESPQDIPLDPGPKLRERLTNTGAIGEYKQIFDDVENEAENIDPEKCHRCQRLVPSSSGKYVPHDNRPDDEMFVCDNCLSPSS
jgi:hypothetical protein